MLLREYNDDQVQFGVTALIYTKATAALPSTAFGLSVLILTQ